MARSATADAGPRSEAELLAEAQAAEAEAAAIEERMLDGAVEVSLRQVDQARERGRVARFRAEREAEERRQGALAVLRGEMLAYADAEAGFPAEFGRRLVAVYREAASLRELVAEHNAAVAGFAARATGLGCRPAPPGGPAAADQGVAASDGRVRVDGIVLEPLGDHVARDALVSVVEGEEPLVPAVIRSVTATRPEWLVFDAGNVATWTRATLPKAWLDKLSRGEMVALDDEAISDWMAGRLSGPRLDEAVARCREAAR